MSLLSEKKYTLQTSVIIILFIIRLFIENLSHNLVVFTHLRLVGPTVCDSNLGVLLF